MGSTISFPLPNDVNNIEFGAGRGYFGKVEFPECFLTDVNCEGLTHFTEAGEDINNCHYLDKTVDYFNFDSKGRKFNTLIFCNPFNFGLSMKYEALKFLRKAESLLINNGEIFLLGQHSNGFIKKQKAEKWINYHNKEYGFEKWKIDRELDDVELDEINKRNIFRKTTGEEIYANVGYYLKMNSDV